MSNEYLSESLLPHRLRIGQDMRNRIRSGEWNSDTPLPPERQLAIDYGVAVGTIRGVMADLVDEKYVTRIQGRGTFIHRGKFDKSFSRFFRMSTDSTGTPSGRIQTIKQRSATPVEVEVFDLTEDKNVLAITRHRLSGNRVVVQEEIVLPCERFGAFIGIEKSELDGLLYEKYESVAGVLISTANEVLRITQPTPELSELLQLDPGEPIAEIQRIAHDLAGYPVEIRTSRGGTKNFEYRIEIS